MHRGAMLLLGLVVLDLAFALTPFWPSCARRAAPATPTSGATVTAAVQAATPNPATAGKDLATRMGCLACHSVDGTRLIGASWKGLSGSTRDLESGESVTADAAYLAESIRDPDAKVVKSYPAGLMGPSIQSHQATLAKQETIDALLAYIESLK